MWEAFVKSAEFWIMTVMGEVMLSYEESSSVFTQIVGLQS